MLATSRLGVAALLLICGMRLCACGNAAHRVDTQGGRSKQRTGETKVVSRLPPGVAVTVGSQDITEETVEHWVAVYARLLYNQSTPTRQVPAGVVPVPPRYRACVAYLSTLMREGSGSEAAHRAEMRMRCRSRREALFQQALQALILGAWIKDETGRIGITLSTQDVDAELRRQFTGARGLRRFLARTGIWLSDERTIVEGELLRARWEAKAVPAYARLLRSKAPETKQTVREIDLALGRLSASMNKRETPNTHCRPGYVLIMCSEYAGA